ncbi:zinc knuckle domain-containing protein [Purpureocillium lilacinum]|uniref:Zinc knuckle domain-containing protein n=1 Tax=Purpureocillium lilacinum TaxID=33203 RepID=A0A179H5W8_PURLI|nr:zinc knuckle domain-containing protein [Purpureocillium lilacinum]OAQ85576.1 zinc knuckle domain-containing protein [Purpureocillium lilacinum]
MTKNGDCSFLPLPPPPPPAPTGGGGGRDGGGRQRTPLQHELVVMVMTTINTTTNMHAAAPAAPTEASVVRADATTAAGRRPRFPERCHSCGITGHKAKMCRRCRNAATAV